MSVGDAQRCRAAVLGIADAQPNLRGMSRPAGFWPTPPACPDEGTSFGRRRGANRSATGLTRHGQPVPRTGRFHGTCYASRCLGRAWPQGRHSTASSMGVVQQNHGQTVAMTFRKSLYMPCALVVAGLFVSGVLARAANTSLPDFNGVWRLDQLHSDDVSVIGARLRAEKRREQPA